MFVFQTVVWQPPGIDESWLEVLGWSDLVPAEGLLSALIVYAGEWHEIKQYLNTIPNDVNLAMVCQQNEKKVKIDYLAACV